MSHNPRIIIQILPIYLAPWNRSSNPPTKNTSTKLGGWLNHPFEKHARANWIMKPQGSGWKYKIIWNHHPEKKRYAAMHCPAQKWFFHAQLPPGRVQICSTRFRTMKTCLAWAGPGDVERLNPSSPQLIHDDISIVKFSTLKFKHPWIEIVESKIQHLLNIDIQSKLQSLKLTPPKKKIQCAQHENK